MISEHLLGWLTLLIVILIITLIAKKHPKTSNFIFVALLLRSIFVIFDEYFFYLPGSRMDAWTFEQFAFRYSENFGLDIVLPDSYSIFVVYERNQAFDNSHSGHNDNLYIAIGYLPGKNTEYAFILNGSENLMSKFEIKKDINGFDLNFNINDDLTNLGDSREANIELNKVF